MSCHGFQNCVTNFYAAYEHFPFEVLRIVHSFLPKKIRSRKNIDLTKLCVNNYIGEETETTNSIITANFCDNEKIKY